LTPAIGELPLLARALRGHRMAAIPRAVICTSRRSGLGPGAELTSAGSSMEEGDSTRRNFLNIFLMKKRIYAKCISVGQI
jgi:hypothetical protein